MDQVPTKVILTLTKIVELLVSKDYRELERLSGGVRLSASDIDQAVRDYGRELIAPPPADLQNANVIEISSAEPRSWTVTYDLWTETEGGSDLSLEATLIDTSDALLKVEIDNIHVL